jgi:hypothetical protein
MSEKTKLNDCLFSIEVKGDDVSINVEGKARDLAETIANAAIHSDEVNTVLKLATMLLLIMRWNKTTKTKLKLQYLEV